jgi:hypothetical protein
MAKTGTTFPSNFENTTGRRVGNYEPFRNTHINRIMVGNPNPLYSNQMNRDMARIRNNENRDRLLLQGGWYSTHPKFQPAGSFNTPLNVNGNSFYGRGNQLVGGGLLRTKEVQDYYNKILQQRKQQLDAMATAQETGQALQPTKASAPSDNMELIKVVILSAVQTISDMYFRGFTTDIKAGMMKDIFIDLIKYGLVLDSQTLNTVKDSLDNILFNDELVRGSTTMSENKDDRLDLKRLAELYGEMSEERLAQLRESGRALREEVGTKISMETEKLKYIYRIRNLVNHLLETKNLSEKERQLALNTFLRTSRVGQVIGRTVKPLSPEETMSKTYRSIIEDIMEDWMEDRFDDSIKRELEAMLRAERQEEQERQQQERQQQEEGEEEGEEEDEPTVEQILGREAMREEQRGRRGRRQRRAEEAEEQPTRMRQRRTEGRGKKSSNWIEFVKKVAKDKNIPYREALKVASTMRK